MKSYPLLLYFLICNSFLVAQNTGIGTTTPQAKLDIVKSFRAGGASSFITYDSLGGRMTWSNAHLFVPSNQAIIKHSAAGDGLYYNNQQLEYRNTSGTPMFATNWASGNTYFMGNLGVGVTNPIAPLQFSNVLGEKLIFYGDQLSSNYGIGIQSYQLQIHADGNLTDIILGFGKADDFSENLRITGSGAVGININNTTMNSNLNVWKRSTFATANFRGTNHVSHFFYGPNDYTYLRGGKTNSKLIINDIPGGKVGIGKEPFLNEEILDVSGGMRIMSEGTLATSAGIWFNKIDNSGLAAFIGMEDDNYIGLFGARGAGWKFSVRRGAGALKVNGSEGVDGQLLQSNGANAANSWYTPTNNLANNLFTAIGTTSVVAIKNGGPVDIPGLSQAFNVTSASAKIIISYDVYIKANSCFLCGYSTGNIFIVMDGVTVAINAYDLANGVDAQASGFFMLTAFPGNHTIKLMGNGVGTDVTYSCNPCAVAKRMVLEVINQ